MRFPLLIVQSVWFVSPQGPCWRLSRTQLWQVPPTSSAGHCCWREWLWFWDLVLPLHLSTLHILPPWCPDLPQGQLFVWHHTPAFQGNKLLREAALHWTSLTANTAVPFPAAPHKPDIHDYGQQICISQAPRRTQRSVADGALGWWMHRTGEASHPPCLLGPRPSTAWPSLWCSILVPLQGISACC